MISGNILLFKDIKISLGLLITAEKMPALFWKIATSRCQKSANNLIRVSAVVPILKANLSC